LTIPRFLGTAALLASLAVPVTALAQQGPAPATATFAPGARAHHGRHGGGLRKALQSLNLTPAQRTQIDQAFAQTRQANQNPDKATRKANRRQLRSRIDAILTPAQRAQLKAAMQRNHRPA
jgi:Spy/CpxP family protein refolding chaperone